MCYNEREDDENHFPFFIMTWDVERQINRTYFLENVKDR